MRKIIIALAAFTALALMLASCGAGQSESTYGEFVPGIIESKSDTTESGSASGTNGAQTAQSETKADVSAAGTSAADTAAASDSAPASEATSDTSSETTADASAQDTSADEIDLAADETSGKAKLYYGTGDNYTEYETDYEGGLTCDKLVAGLAELTGWNMDLDEPVSSGKGGVTVTFAETCSLFAGPPENQKAGFEVYDLADLASKMLDSTAKTLRMNVIDPELSDPELLNVYFEGPGGTPLELKAIGFTLPLDMPYGGSEAMFGCAAGTVDMAEEPAAAETSDAATASESESETSETAPDAMTFLMEHLADYYAVGPATLIMEEEPQKVNGDECRVYAVGTDDDDSFVREMRFAIPKDLSKIYEYDAATDTWSVVYKPE